MPYYPKTRFIPNKKTSGNEFSLPDGSNYIGDYYITFDGNFYTGKNPQTKNSIKLTRLKQKDEINNNLVNNYSTKKYTQLNPQIELSTFTEPKPFIPTITQQDFQNKKITRYFAKERKIRDYKIIEIDFETYDDILKRGGIYNYPKWDVVSIFWMITDNEKDKEFTQNTNQRIINIKNKNFIGIREYLTDLLKYSKL